MSNLNGQNNGGVFGAVNGAPFAVPITGFVPFTFAAPSSQNNVPNRFNDDNDGDGQQNQNLNSPFGYPGFGPGGNFGPGGFGGGYPGGFGQGGGFGGGFAPGGFGYPPYGVGFGGPGGYPPYGYPPFGGPFGPGYGPPYGGFGGPFGGGPFGGGPFGGGPFGGGPFFEQGQKQQDDHRKPINANHELFEERNKKKPEIQRTQVTPPTKKVTIVTRKPEIITLTPASASNERKS